MADAVTERVKQYIQEQRLPDTGILIVGLSGGADSVVLLHVLSRLGYSCIAAHCNFHLRAEESMRDEMFAGRFSASLGVPFRKIDVDTEQYARDHKLSIEMAAREIRYRWFEELRTREKAEAVAVAHHQDDSVETVLLNLIRGTGWKGLTGIQPRNRNVIRPLLCLSRKEIINYVRENRLEYVTDSSNLQDEFVRNKIRNQLLPLMATINPSVTEAIARTADNLRESSLILTQAMEEYRSVLFTNGKISIAKLRETPSSEAVLFELLKEYEFNPDVVRNVARSLDGSPGKVFYSPGFRLVIDRDSILITSRLKTEAGEYRIEKNDRIVDDPIRLQVSYSFYYDGFPVDKNPCCASLDADKLHFPLVLRRWESGDRFKPFGMNGFKKLSDYFSDHKFSLIDKENVWILCSGDDICWVVGHRTDNRFRIDENTKEVCVIKLL